MIKTEVVHPEILKILAGAGHGSKIVIVDGNFPVLTGAPAEVPRVYLNFSPGVIDVPTVLKGIAGMIPVEAAEAAAPAEGPEPEIFGEYREILPHGINIAKRDRFEFYDIVKSRETALIIATAEKRVYSCICLTVGVRTSFGN